VESGEPAGGDGGSRPGRRPLHGRGLALAGRTPDRPADREQLSDAELLELIPEAGRAVLVATGLLAENFSADDLRKAIPLLKDQFRDQGFTAAKAAVIILDGVRSGAWRILVGDEAKMLDEQVRANPEAPLTTTTTRRCTAP
jgi:hypothetical protein